MPATTWSQRKRALSHSVRTMATGASDRRRMDRPPVPGDVDAAADPDPVVALDMVEEALQRREPPRPPGEAAMEADRHHLRPFGALGVEHVEGVAQIGEELLAAVE